MFALAIVAIAQAAPPQMREVAEGDFVVQAGTATARVLGVGIPTAVAIPPQHRVCRVEMRLRSGAWSPHVHDSCHPKLVDAARDAAQLWDIALDPDPGRDRTLFEAWYLFPSERKGDVRLQIPQAWDTRLTALSEWIDVPQLRVKGRVFPIYPDEAATMDTDITQCDVHLEISTSGAPTAVEATRCDPVFHEAAETALRLWFFDAPTVDGAPIHSAVTLGVSFVRVHDEDRLGRAEVQLPPDPDVGGRTVERVEIEERTPPTLPTWPAMFTMNHRSYAEVDVFDVRWPDPIVSDVDRTCDVLFQVNSARLVWAWAEACDPVVKQATEMSANQWNLKPGHVERGEWYARFRGTLVFPANGDHVILRVPEEDLASDHRRLPPYVETYQAAIATRRIAPKLPRVFATEVVDARVICEYRVQVDTRGRPEEMTHASCPASFVPHAESALAKWRWSPAQANGKPISSVAIVRVRFDQPVIEDSPMP